jgi:hypothetical protein
MKNAKEGHPMSSGKITIETELIEAWLPLTCDACPKPAIQQETAHYKGKRINGSSIGHCGDESCAANVKEKVRSRIAELVP